MTSIRWEEAGQWIAHGDYAQAIIRLEGAILEGWRPDAAWLDRLPREVTARSPLLQKAVGERLADAGRLAEAKQLLQQAVKAFARQAFQQEMLASLALLASVYMRTGDQSDAQTALLFLKQECDGGETEPQGTVLLALACGARLIGEEAKRGERYAAAFDWFDRCGDIEYGGRTALDMLLDLGTALGVNVYDMQAMLRLRCGSDPVGAVYERAYDGLLLFADRRWAEAADILGAIGCGEVRLPAHLDVIVRCYAQLAQLRKGNPPDVREEERLLTEVRRHASDVSVQRHAIRLEFERRLRTGDEEGARAALGRAAVYDKLCPSAFPEAVETLRKSANAVFGGRKQEMERDTDSGQWSVFCFGPLHISDGTVEIRDISWRRKKAHELFVYLLLQPNYACPRDQVVEALFAGIGADKQANQLYVTIHRLKQVLKETFHCDNAVMIRDGIVKIAPSLIEYADVEQYRSLVRVGDQLWANDRGLAAELYEQAVRLYDELAPELPYVDWLETYRNHYAEMQAMTLKKLVQVSIDQLDYDAAEARCTAWIRLKPTEEEAYQHMIRLLMLQGKKAAASGWYRKLEKVCAEELNVMPLPETKQLLRGDRS